MGEYESGVFRFEDCGDVVIENSVLYSRGPEGLFLNRVKGLEFRNSALQNCSAGIMSIQDSRAITFRKATFRNNRGMNELIWLGDNSGILFDRCLFQDNQAKEGAVFHNVGSTGVRIEGTSILHNEAKYLSFGYKLEVAHLKLKDNSPGLKEWVMWGREDTTCAPIPVDAELGAGNPFGAYAKTKWGMSLKEVKRVAKGKLISQDPRTLIYGSKLLGRDCSIRYVFDETGLVEACYEIRGILGDEGYAQKDLEQILALLEKYYQKPGILSVEQAFFSTRYWMIPDLLTVIYLGIAELDPSLIFVRFVNRKDNEWE